MKQNQKLITPARRLRNELYQLQGHKITIVTFARFMNCSESLLRGVETGKVLLSAKMAMRMSRLTGASVEWLMGEMVEPDSEVKLAPSALQLQIPDPSYDVAMEIRNLLFKERLREFEVIGRMFQLLGSCQPAQRNEMIGRLDQWVRTEAGL